jgi:hypothetical protein
MRPPTAPASLQSIPCAVFRCALDEAAASLPFQCNESFADVFGLALIAMDIHISTLADQFGGCFRVLTHPALSSLKAKLPPARPRLGLIPS